METTSKKVITIESIVNAPIEKVWSFWNDPKCITQWNQASPDWHTPSAENDLRVGGKFKATMAAKDGSVSFDFEGVYKKVKEHQLLEYDIADGRQVKVEFSSVGTKTKIIESFEAESENP